MFRQVFDANNLFWRLIGKAVDFVGLRLFCIALSLPIVTIVPAFAALYYTVIKTFYQGEDGAFGLYWKAFVLNLKRGIPITLICLPIVLLLARGYSIMAANSDSGGGKLMYMAFYVALLVPTGIMCYLIPMLGRFELATGQLFYNAAFLTLRHLASKFVVVVLNVQFLIFTLEKWWPIYFTPVCACLLSALFLEGIFAKYLTQKEREIFENKQKEDIN